MPLRSLSFIVPFCDGLLFEFTPTHFAGPCSPRVTLEAMDKYDAEKRGLETQTEMGKVFALCCRVGRINEYV